MDTLIGKLREVFKEVGRDVDWNSAFAVGNPAATNEVKCYLKAVTSEQFASGCYSQTSYPLICQKAICFVNPTCISAALLFLLARDDAFFKCLFFSGDRTNDLTLVKSQEVLRLPNDQGFLFNHIWGKTLRDGTTNIFAIRRYEDISLCPIAAVERYFSVSSTLGVDLATGFLFLPLTPRHMVENKQLSTGALQSRLKLYLENAGIYDGESLHSFRSGIAITLALSGSQLSDVMEHVGWRQTSTASHYMKVARVLRPGGPSELLSRSNVDTDLRTESYIELNRLSRFTKTFPGGSNS